MKAHFGTAIAMAATAILVAGGYAMTIISFEQLRQAGLNRARHTMVMERGHELLSSLKDAETGYRGYLLTGDPGFLEPYRMVRNQIMPDLIELRALATDPAAQFYLDAMAPVVLQKMANTDKSIQLRRLGNQANLDEISGRGKSLMDTMRTQVAGFLQVEQGNLNRTEAAVAFHIRTMKAVMFATSLMTMVLGLLFAYLLRRRVVDKLADQVHRETKHLLNRQEELNGHLTKAISDLQENEARLNVTLRSIGDAVLTTDGQGRVVILNPLAERFTGWTQAEAMGHPVAEVFQIINQETRQSVILPVQETLARGVIRGLANHTVAVARDGTECAIADSCAPIRTSDGNVIGAVLVFRDVTQEHAAQADLEQARRMAEKASQAKSDFLSSMSHEIRTPMNAIIGMSYLALKTELTPRQRDYLKKIKGSSQHLLGIINDILDFSKIEAGKLVLEHTEFEIEKVLDNVANLIADKAATKGLELVFDIDKDVPAILVGDPLRLGQILINYCNNAVKFTEKGEIDVIIRLREHTENGPMLYFAVRDTGIGLSQEEIGRLFQSFSQVDPSVTRKFGGSGLGLVISKKLADLMDGDVGVSSVPGQGSTFWFTACFGVATCLQRKLVLSMDLQGRRVLVVDDLKSSRLVLGRMLKSMGFLVDLVASGPAALDALAKADEEGRSYEVVTLDWLMPGMDGLETSRRIGQAGLRVAPKQMLVTGYSREEVIRSAEALGIEHVLIKPVSASLLFDNIVNLLGGTSKAPRKGYDEATETFGQLASLGKVRVLLVEDNDLNQEVASELLRGAGFIVDLAENGQIAVDMVRLHDYAIVLMDLQMPVMDGLTATQLIRSDPRFQELPVVAMTANAMVGDRNRCLAAGMNDHIAKPIDPEDLWKMLLKWVRPGAEPQPARPAMALNSPVLPAVEGLEMGPTLRRLLGNSSLYLSMLRKYRQGEQDVPAAIRRALDADDWVTAERLAHTLKSVSANIGATRVQLLAMDLESAMAAHPLRAEAETRLLALEGPLRDLIRRLDLNLPPEASRAVVAVDPENLARVSGQLANLLHEDDGEAGDFLEAQADLFATAYPDRFRELERDIQSFHYEEAMVVLNAAMAAPR